VGTNWWAQLYDGADANSLVPVAAAPALFREVPATQPGTWRGGNRILSGFNGGDTVVLHVKVWNGSLFPTFETAIESPGAIYGVSDRFTYFIPTLQNPPATLLFMENFRGFQLVPEPPVIMFGALGTFVFIRRRRLR